MGKSRNFSNREGLGLFWPEKLFRPRVTEVDLLGRREAEGRGHFTVTTSGAREVMREKAGAPRDTAFCRTPPLLTRRSLIGAHPRQDRTGGGEQVAARKGRSLTCTSTRSNAKYGNCVNGGE